MQSLELYSRNLTGSIPLELGNLTELYSLSLGDNELTGSIPPELRNLTNLIRFYLDNNQLIGTIPSWLGNLTKLEHLELDGNQLTGTIPPKLGNLINLQGLHLEDNELTGTIPVELGNLTNLKYLQLHNNHLCSTEQELIKFLDNIDNNKPNWGNSWLNWREGQTNTVCNEKQSFTISGTVSLPPGDIAPAGGVELSFSVHSNHIKITIPQGQSSVPYSIDIPTDYVDSIHLGMYCVTNCDGYVEAYYYSAIASKTYTGNSTFSTENLQGGKSHTNVNMTLYRGVEISGTISLPPGETAQKEFSVGIWANELGTGGEPDHNNADYVQFPIGASSVSYSIMVFNDPTIEWGVVYECDGYLENGYSYNVCGTEDYIRQGQYGKNGTKSGSFSISLDDPNDSKFILQGGQKHSNINLTIQRGVTISGTISLPAGKVATSDRLYTWIYINNDADNSRNYGNYIIPEGKSSIPYRIAVSDDPLIEWLIRYDCSSCTNDFYYYTSDGGTNDYQNKQLLKGGQNHSNINLLLHDYNNPDKVPPIVNADPEIPNPEEPIKTDEVITKLPDLTNGTAINQTTGEITETNSSFHGGIKVNEELTQATTITPNEPITIQGTINVDDTHVGEPADILVVTSYKPTNAPEDFITIDDQNTLHDWDGNLDNIKVIAKIEKLPKQQPVDIYNGKLPIGKFKFWFGYRLTNGEIIFNGSKTIDTEIANDTTGTSDTNPKSSILNDIAWIYTRNLTSNSSTATIFLRLNDLAKEFIAQDINGDGRINRLDLAIFDLDNEEHVNKLNINIEVLYRKDVDNDSIISTYETGNLEKLLKLLDDVFGDRLTLYPEKDSRAKQVKIEVIPFGAGSFIADSGRINFDSERDNATNNSFDFYDKSNSVLTITATPKTDPNDPLSDTDIIKWDGCDSVTPDLSQCEISLQTDRQISITFGYKTSEIVDNFIDLSAATAIFENDSRLHVTIDSNNGRLIRKMAKLTDGYYITGSTGDGFLKKVTAVNKISNIEYYLETTFASLEEVVKQGTGTLSKIMRNKDIDTSGQTRSSNNIPFSDIDGVRLIRSEDPEDDTFTIVIGEPNTRKKIDLFERGISDKVELYAGVEATGSINLNLKIDVGLSFGTFGIFSGIESFKFIPEITAKESIEVSIDGKIPFIKKQKWLGAIRFKLIPLQIGLVRIYLRPKIDVFVGINGEVNGKISTGIYLTQTLRVGVSYDDDTGFNTINEFKSQPLFNRPKAEVSGMVKGFITPEASLKIYGLTGPSIPLSGHIRLVIDKKGDDKGVKPETWKDEKCDSGYNFSAWAGIDSKFKWTFVEEKDATVLGKSVVKQLSKLNFNFPIYQNEWPLETWNVDDEGNYSDCTPPHLKVDGKNIREKVLAQSNKIITRDYTLSNTGGRKLDWKIEYKKDNVITVSKTYGILAMGEKETVTVTIDTSMISNYRRGVARYTNSLKFVNNSEEVELLADSKTGTTTKSVFVEMVLYDPEDFIEATSSGDPHLNTFDRLAYDFQAVGEFILVKDNDGAFEIQVRQKPAGRNISVNQATAMNVAGDRVGFYPSKKFKLIINGNPQELLINNSIKLPNGGYINRYNSEYAVIWPNNEAVVFVGTYFVNVYINKSKKGKIIGLLGNANGDPNDDITKRNGVNLGTNLEFSTLYPEYADSWRISQEESLFDYAEGESTETFTDRSFPYALATTANLSDAQVDKAEKICRDARITNPVILDNCILDVALTEEPGFAQSFPDMEEELTTIEVNAVRITSNINNTVPPNATISIYKDDVLVSETTTNDDGSYTVDGLQENTNYKAVIEKDDDVLGTVNIKTNDDDIVDVETIVQTPDIERTSSFIMSTQALVGDGDNKLITNFTISESKTIVIRALSKNSQLDPLIKLYLASDLIAENNNWQDDENANGIPTALKSSNELDATLLRDLEPGNYTVIVNSADGIDGVGLIAVNFLE